MNKRHAEMTDSTPSSPQISEKLAQDKPVETNLLFPHQSTHLNMPVETNLLSTHPITPQTSNATRLPPAQNLTARPTQHPISPSPRTHEVN